MGDLTYTEKTFRNHMYCRANGNGRAALRLHPGHRFLIDECRITELFSFYLVNFVKHLHSKLPDMMLIDEELHPVKA
ncbi:hypothetical protein TNCV_4853441 [Trichonephila clavipes]|nr:hypothetical protein TNCV_4853441 [Trichonephila clavipes]